MKLGLATRQAISGVPKGRAHMLAQWVSLTPGYSPSMYRPTPARPLIYLESHLHEGGYRGILRGELDQRLRSLKADIPANAIIRWDHEMTGPASHWRTWGGMDPSLYVDVFRHVAGILGPLQWSAVTGPQHYARYRSYYPGDPWTHFPGFTYYDHGKRTPLPLALRRAIAAVRELTDKRILITELGCRRVPGVRGGVRWLRSLLDVEDCWGACYFDVDMRVTDGPRAPDWRMTRAMRRAWDGMAA